MSTTNLSPPPKDPTQSAYSPQAVEAKWTAYWFDNNLFNLDINPDKPTYSIALPPPNVTGNLHMGHALNGTLQDILVRLKRMQGYNVLWQPGTDHAGISTQMVVERDLKKNGISRHDLGREKFIEKVRDWRDQYGNQIINQYKRLGVSFCFERLAYTMDAKYAQAVYRAFVILYKEGFIYRGNRVTNWCPRCLTSVSDLEVEHEERQGHLYYIKYRLVDQSGDLVVATTRPETIFGDVAIAVHPDDERFKQLVGKFVRVPLTDRQIPVIGDSYVERDFGTGALKITPAHDVNDFEVGQRHKLPAPIVIDKEGKLNDSEFVPPSLSGKDRFLAREAVAAQLEETGLLSDVKEYSYGLGHCERCQTVIEPYLTDQWYLSMKELAKPAMEEVENGHIQFIPERYAATYLDWMRNIRDWNISRQLWWGHRIPIWTCQNDHSDAYEIEPAQCSKCNSKILTQDEDVLDTWFSSALWPFATLGWPEDTRELRAFYPTSVLSTAREIIYLWVSRMIFTSLKFVKKIPFKQVLIHPVIQTADGKRMSKSKGNVIDPLDMIGKYGADANRFWFAAVGVKGDQDVRFREDRLEEYKRFVNKLWNAGRFVTTQLGDYRAAGTKLENLTLADRWILHRYNSMLQKVSSALSNYDFHEAAGELYDFTWDYFCDWYLEIAKIQTSREANKETTCRILYIIFEGLLRALHPIMPFVTEELWSRLPKSSLFSPLISIMFAPFPRADEQWLDEKVNIDMSFLITIIRAIRNIRQTYNVPVSAQADVVLVTSDDNERKILEAGLEYISRLSRTTPVVTSPSKMEAPKAAAKEIISSVTIHLPLANLIDIAKSREKLLQRKGVTERQLQSKEETLGNKEFKAKAPREKVIILEAEVSVLVDQLTSVKAQLQVLDECP